MVKGVYEDKPHVFYFNLSADVGAGCPNHLDDVEFVRFGIYCAAQKLSSGGGSPLDAAFVLAAAKVGKSGPFDPALGDAILALQKSQKLREDSRVDVAKGIVTPHGTIYLLQNMQFYMRYYCKHVYPRIDLMSETGAEISRAVRFMFIRDI